ncbi:DUF4142 domain-containing protein [Simulacricoccus sp. 17bor-14]|nr:DUF4142 domain-containing protein [Simulacricoccus sp. 17bor-14]
MKGQANKMESKADKSMDKSMKEMKGATKGMAEHMGFMIPTDAKAFMERLHFTNQSEIKEAKLAQQKSQNADVKSYAQQMEQEHTQADQKLMSYAQSKGMKLADMPKPMNDMEKKAMAAHKATMEELEAMQGTPFDSKYLATQVAAHDMAIGKVMAAQAEMKSADAQMTQMLSELSQKLPMHRQMAYAALGKLGSQMKMGATGGSGSDSSSGSASDTSSTGGSGSGSMSDTSGTGGAGSMSDTGSSTGSSMSDTSGTGGSGTSDSQ